MKHTQGPWEVAGIVAKKLPFHVMRHNGQHIANTVADSWMTKDEELANARLIAAAPDLLAALQRIIEIRALVPGAEADIRARAAIAKAVQS